MLIHEQVVALFVEGFNDAALKSNGAFFAKGSGLDLIVTDGDKYDSRAVGHFVQMGYFENWSKAITALLHDIVVPITVMGANDSAIVLIDMIEKIGFGVFHRHENNDSRWKKVCENYRAEINAYGK